MVMEIDEPTAVQGNWWPLTTPPRAAVIDIGSNAMRLAIYDVVDGRGHEVYTERARPQLGRDLDPDGRLDPQRVEDALGALARFRFLANHWGVRRIYAVATAAIRMASGYDREAFIRHASRIIGAPVRVLSGPEEARYSAEGVLNDWPEAAGLVADIGGLSLEIAPIGFGMVLDDGRSFEVGPLAFMQEREHSGDETVRERVVDIVREDVLAPWAEFNLKTLYGVGGAWRNIAACDMRRNRGRPLPMNGYSMSRQRVEETLAILETGDAKSVALMNSAEVSSRRRATLPTAALVLRKALSLLPSERVVISTSGVRQGVLLHALRAQPLVNRRRLPRRRPPRRSSGRSLQGK